MLDANCENALLDFVQPGCLEQLRKVTLAGTRKLRLILDLGIKLVRCLPEQAEWPLAATVIPNARCHDTTLARHARHLTKSHDGVCHEVNDELSQGRVEGLVWERQVFR